MRTDRSFRHRNTGLRATYLLRHIAPEPYRYQQETAGGFEGHPMTWHRLKFSAASLPTRKLSWRRSGYYRSDIDGIFGPGTEFALRAFQSRSGLPADRPLRYTNSASTRFDARSHGVPQSRPSLFAAPGLPRRVDPGLTTFIGKVISFQFRIAPTAIPRRPCRQRFARRCAKVSDRNHRKSRSFRGEICDAVQGLPFFRSCLTVDRA